MSEKTWQTFTAAQWPKPRDPSIHVDLSVDAGPLLSVVQAADHLGRQVGPTSLIVRALGEVFAEHPEANVEISRGRVRQRDRVDAWVTMDADDGRLAGRRVDGVAQRDALDLQEEIRGAAEAYRTGKSSGTDVAYRMIRWLPLPILRAFFAIAGFLIHTVKVPFPAFGIGGGEGFGLFHVTNVGGFGLRRAAVPIPPVTRHAYLFTVGEIHTAPVVRDGQVVAGEVLPITGTIDHRYVVGAKAAAWARAFQDRLTDRDRLLSFLPEDLREEAAGILRGGEHRQPPPGGEGDP